MISEFVDTPQWKFVKLRNQWDGHMIHRGGINMGVTWSLTTRKEHTWRMFESKVLRTIPRPQSKKAEGCGKKNYITRNIKIIFCTHHKILRWSNWKWGIWWGQAALKKREKYVQNFVRKTWSNHLGNLVVDGWIILRWIIRKVWYDSME